MIYPRAIFPKLEKELAYKENTVITGMRQVGKTTILNHLFSLVSSTNKVILDFENPLNRKMFEEENYDAIWQNLAPFGIRNTEMAYLFLDEVQLLSSIGSVAKYLSDHYPVKFILTGSSSYYLKNLFPESQAGRKLIFEVFPLTFSEFLVFKGINRAVPDSFSEKAEKKNNIAYERLIPLYREYLTYGGLPKVVLQSDIQRKKDLLNDAFTSYFERDVKELADFKDTTKLRDLILLLTPRVGGKMDVTKLAASIDVSRDTIYAYLAFLEKTYFIHLLPKFTGSLDRQTAGNKKVFFCDSGIANQLGKLSEGQLFEQSVFQTLQPNHKLHYYTTAEGNEIDFIVDEKIALEAKLQAGKQDIYNIKRRAKSQNMKESYAVTLAYTSEEASILATDL